MRYCLWSFLLACLVLLASPFQGVANAATVDCHGVAMEQHAQMVMDAAVDAHHSGKADKCNLCSPCCAGALVNTVQVPAVATVTTGATFPDPTSANPAPTLAGLDRPPRLLAL